MNEDSAAPARRVMLDLETLGTVAGSAVVGIGAVAAHGANIVSTFEAKIDLRSCQAAGLFIDADTVMWWLRQQEEARRQIYDARTVLPEALGQFSAWFAEWGGPETEMWGNGVDFDNAILSEAYKALDLRIPWKWTRNRCFRTVRNLFADVTAPPSEGTAHRPLDDAKNQMRHLLAILEKIDSLKSDSCQKPSDPLSQDASEAEGSERRPAWLE